jgi:hypothetical protein
LYDDLEVKNEVYPAKKAESAWSMSNSQQIAFHPNTKRRFSDVPTPYAHPKQYIRRNSLQAVGLNRTRQCSAIKKSDVYPVQNFYKRVELRINLGSYSFELDFIRAGSRFAG